MNSSQITEHELQAYVDGRLEPQRRAEIDAYLAEHPDEALRSQSYRLQNIALAELFDPMLNEPVPPSLHTFDRHRLPGGKVKFAALVASFALAVGIGWVARGFSTAPIATAPAWAQRALVAHAVYAPEVLHPVEVNASEEQHLSRWLSKRLGMPLKAPDLSTAGFELVGGRLLPDAPKPAAQFMYQNGNGVRLTLYVTPRAPGRETAFRFEQSERLSAFYWVDQGSGYALSGEVSRAELLRVAELAYRGLDR